MDCPYCQAQNRDSARFCSNCGRLMPQQASGGISSQPSTISAPAPAVRGNSGSIAIGTPLQGGRYIIKGILGQGGMGTALLATDKRLDDKQVVIKELLSESTDPQKRNDDEANFKREVATFAHLDHPLIPNFTNHFEEKWHFFMVQEYVEGENLEDHIDRLNQPMKERDVLVHASEILDVLDYLSGQTPPIVHRDIKPANIVIGSKDKRAHLVDFGIARADMARNAKRKQTSALGTPGYAPPEQYQGNADPRSDLYALGATLHHLVSNRDPRNYPPFNFPPVRTINSQLSPEMEHLLTRALHNDINLRYQSAAAMKHDVDEILFKRFTSGTLSYNSSGAMAAVTVPITPNSTSTVRNSQTPLSPLPQPPAGSALYPAPPQLQQPRRKRTRRTQQVQHSLFALASTTLTNGEIAFVGETYTVQAGIAQQKLPGFRGSLFTIFTHNSFELISFDVSCHVSDNIELLRQHADPWSQVNAYLDQFNIAAEHQQQNLVYDPRQPAGQFVAFHFTIVQPGESSITIDFYRERHLLQTIQLTFAAKKRTIPAAASMEEG